MKNQGKKQNFKTFGRNIYKYIYVPNKKNSSIKLINKQHKLYKKRLIHLSINEYKLLCIKNTTVT